MPLCSLCSLLHFQYVYISSTASVCEQFFPCFLNGTNFSVMPSISYFKQVQHSVAVSYRIAGNTQNWIKSFLSNRKERVSVNGAVSDIIDVIFGITQGSVLGPVLFLLYINDIGGNIKSSIRLFADDSIIYHKISSKTDQKILQTDLNQLQTWSDKWQMEFNVSKCVHLLITTKIKPSQHKYSLFGQPLSTVSSHSYLRVKLDSKLTWTNHVTDIASKSSKVLGMIK